jgi:hypothetical protein
MLPTIDAASGSGGAGGAAGHGGAAGEPEEDASSPPDGPWVLTWANGVSDIPAARLCFVPVLGGIEVPPASKPWPPAGLAFGQQATLSAFEGIDLLTTELHPYLVAPGAPAAATCREILEAADAGAPGSVVVLPILPAGTLAEQRSYLLVSTGCVKTIFTHEPPFVDASSPGDARDDGPAEADAGAEADDGAAGGDAAPALADANAADARPPEVPPPTGPDPSVCGGDGKPGSGAATLLLFALSRHPTFDMLGLQAAHASAATPAMLVRMTPEDGQASLYLTSSVSSGQLSPRTPALFARHEFGTVLGAAKISIAPTTSTSVATFESTLGEILARSGIAEEEFTTAKNFVLVLLGAAPGAHAGPGTQPFTAILVDSAPTPPP